MNKPKQRRITGRGKSMGNIYIQEDYIDATDPEKPVRCGDSGDVYETWTDDLGDLYRSLVREYGRCTGSVYIDRTDGTTVKVGWVFQKRVKYDQGDGSYLRETWVTVHEKPPTKTIEYHYFPPKRKRGSSH